MRARWLCCFLLVVGATCALRAGVAAEPEAPAFRLLGESRPFQAEVISEVMQDRVGFLWIGTREGLYLHDGQRFRKFQHEVQNPASISSNGIRGILEDSRGRLWVNTMTGGLNLLDRANWRFRHWRHDDADPASLSHDGVFMLAEADHGRLWVGTQAGLDLFDPDSGRFEHVPLAKGDEFVLAVHRDRAGGVWAGTLGRGLFHRAPGATRFAAVPMAVRGRKPPVDVFNVKEDAAGRIWVGARDGLYRVAANGRGLEIPAIGPSEVADVLANVTDLEPTDDGTLWIGTFGVGLYRLDTASGQIADVPLGDGSPGSRHIDEGALEFGRDGGLFVGTFGGGLLKSIPGASAAQVWRARSADKPGLVSEDVYALLSDGGSGLLAGSFGGGVDRIDVDANTVAPLMMTGAEQAGMRLSGVLDLLRARDGALWVGTSRGVYRWHPQRREYREYREYSAPGYTYALLQDRADRIWIGTGGAGLYRYRPERDDFERFHPEPGNPRSLSDDFVTSLLEDARGRLWVGTRSGGVNVCRTAAVLDCERIAIGAGAIAISHHHVASLLEAPDGAIWLGTGGGGLNRIEFDRNGWLVRVRRWSRADGLIDDNVMALAYAPDGALWLSTRGGLSRFDARTGQFENHTVADGLPTAEFNPKAVALHAGRMYFGSTKGVVALDPLHRPRRGEAPPTVISTIAGIAPDRLPPRPAWRLDRLPVRWRQPFSLEFAVLGYNGGETEYAYRLADDEPWIGLGDRGQLTLHELPPGRYRLQVRGRQAGTAWTAARPLELDVVPPWWRRPAVIAAAAGSVLLLVLFGFLRRLHVLQRRNRELQVLQAQKEGALTQARASHDQLESAFERLRRMTMRLEAAKEEEKKHLARELHDEFGQALTAAKINLGLAMNHAGTRLADERVAETITLVERLINQVRALALDLRPPLFDELGLLAAVEGYLQDVAQRTGKRIEVQLPAALPTLGAVRDLALFRVVQEAVTNTLRHAQASTVTVALRAIAGGVEVEIHDDGVGFDTDAALTGGVASFGLFGMRERVEDFDGRLTLHSTPGAGTTIMVFIPQEPADAYPRPAG